MLRWVKRKGNSWTKSGTYHELTCAYIKKLCGYGTEDGAFTSIYEMISRRENRFKTEF